LSAINENEDTHTVEETGCWFSPLESKYRGESGFELEKKIFGKLCKAINLSAAKALINIGDSSISSFKTDFMHKNEEMNTEMLNLYRDDESLEIGECA
jgi:hypothetical protein